MQTHLTLVGNNLGGLKEKAAVLQIHHLSLQSILHDINQSQLICQLLQRMYIFHTQTLTSHLFWYEYEIRHLPEARC